MQSEPPRRSRAPAQPAVYAPSGLRLDETDLRLLRVLQEGAREPIKTLAERIALSHNSTLHRLNRLEDSGAILRYRADIDESIFGTWAFYAVHIVLTPLGRANLGRLKALIVAAPEITEASGLVGEWDLALRVALQKPADWMALQADLDPSADLIHAAHLHPYAPLIKHATPHPLFMACTS